MRISLGYTTLANEMKILEVQRHVHPIQELEPVVSLEEALTAQKLVKDIYVSEPVKQYIVELVWKTRKHPDVYLGASPRGSLGLFRAGQAKAALEGRDYVLPDDIKYMAVNILSHRVVVNPAARLTDVNASQIVKEIVDSHAVPGGDPGSFEA